MSSPNGNEEVRRDARGLERQVQRLWWYHTIELPEGIVSPGMFDHRLLVPRYGIPDSLAGRRCLDIACADGFWAFEFERRGGEVVAIDVGMRSEWDWPPGAIVSERPTSVDTFELAKTALGSRAVRVTHNIYDLHSDQLGTFDLVHAADVLLHLERPLEALRRFRSMVAADGHALIADAILPELGDGPDLRYYGGHDLLWFIPSLSCLVQMTYDAGFGDVEVVSVYNVPPRGQQQGLWRAVLRAKP
ncbi:MAG: class I SAM-dependent methyltransferase [Solirubrobacteraceae bacterium]